MFPLDSLESPFSMEDQIILPPCMEKGPLTVDDITVASNASHLMSVAESTTSVFVIPAPVLYKAELRGNHKILEEIITKEQQERSTEVQAGCDDRQEREDYEEEREQEEEPAEEKRENFEETREMQEEEEEDCNAVNFEIGEAPTEKSGTVQQNVESVDKSKHMDHVEDQAANPTLMSMDKEPSQKPPDSNTISSEFEETSEDTDMLEKMESVEASPGPDDHLTAAVLKDPTSVLSAVVEKDNTKPYRKDKLIDAAALSSISNPEAAEEEPKLPTMPSKTANVQEDNALVETDNVAQVCEAEEFSHRVEDILAGEQVCEAEELSYQVEDMLTGEKVQPATTTRMGLTKSDTEQFNANKETGERQGNLTHEVRRALTAEELAEARKRAFVVVPSGTSSSDDRDEPGPFSFCGDCLDNIAFGFFSSDNK